MTQVAAQPTPLERFNGHAFRVLLDCLARPGKIGQLPSPPFSGAPSVSNSKEPNLAAVAACMSLLDQTVSFVQAVDADWMAADHPLTRWITLRTNARAVAPALADFALFHDPSCLALIGELKAGTLLEPEHSCTLFVCVPGIAVDADVTLRLTGPGIKDVAGVGLPGLTQPELVALAQRRPFPLGIDIFVIDQHARCLGLPRTTQIELVMN
ncbi:phosphonate C-P lyase system protein PhnH [Chloroflexus sp.]|uniref:phosphonate C-P lyase system protein PhnH n=1 Tax=Chloroflexus sp. TaxID=1904827 RepID=UPI002624C92A|nr:phosphonate C-P lyase system protein PhnH [uncultured Chloroflexus sp.]